MKWRSNDKKKNNRRRLTLCRNGQIPSMLSVAINIGSLFDISISVHKPHDYHDGDKKASKEQGKMKTGAFEKIIRTHPILTPVRLATNYRTGRTLRDRVTVYIGL